MRNAIVRAQQLRESMTAVERAQGLPPEVMRMGSSRAAQLQIADSTRLPVISDTVALQRADGAFYIIPGYSLVGGPDVAGP